MKKCRKPPQNTFRRRRWRRMMREIEGLLSNPATREILDGYGANLELVIHKRKEELMRMDIAGENNCLGLKPVNIRKFTNVHPYLCYVGDIIQHTESEILKWPRCGLSTRRKLIAGLAQHGLTFANKVYVSAKIV